MAMADKGETDLAWAAGLFDGEGTLGLYKNSSTGRYCYIMFRVKMCTKGDVEEFGRILGVKVRKYKAEKRAWKPVYTVTLNGMGKVKKALEALLPYLRGKRKQAEVMLEYLRFREERSDRGYCRPYTAEEKDEMDKVHLELKRLKKEEE